jgi:DNA-binding transcriptional LysR family regulator
LVLPILQNQAFLPKILSMDINLQDAALFARVAELGTLSAAARERDEPVSQVSRAIARLEAAVGVRLLHRTTHGLSLTDEGDTFLAHARRMLDAAAELEGELSGKLAGPSGWVRVAVSPILAQMFVAPTLSGLYARHPQLHLDIAADDRAVDLARDGIDIAIRAGLELSDNVVARKIGWHGRSLYASPAYVQKNGAPRTPDELAQHHIITNSASPSMNRWTFLPDLAPSPASAGEIRGVSQSTALRHESSKPRASGAVEGRGRDGGFEPHAASPASGPGLQAAARTASGGERPQRTETITLKGTTRADNTAIVLALALEGVGIARINDLLAAPLVASGKLVRLLAPFTVQTTVEIYAVMLPERHRLPKVRACIEYWEECFTALREGVAP